MEVIRLLDFRMFRTDTLVWYSLQLSNGRECWVVTRRYSEFLRCHVKLLELFRREQLPTFPPKEPFWQRVFGGEATRDNWMEERYARLFGYMVGLLDMEGVRNSDALLEFLNAPSHNNGQAQEEVSDSLSPLSPAIAVIRSVRVRLTGEPGGLEVVIRADAPAPCAVRLALRPLEELGEEWGETGPVTLDPSTTGTWERLLELDLDPSKSPELTHPFELTPGSLWQVAAVGVSKDGSMGNVVCIQIRAPDSETLNQVRESLVSPPAEAAFQAQETKAVLDEQNEMKDPGEASSTATHSSGMTGPEGKSQDVESEDERDEDPEGDTEGRARGPGATPSRLKGRPAAGSKVISYQGCVAMEYARKLEEKQRMEAERAPHRWAQGLKCSVPVDRLETKSATGAAERHHYGTVEVLDHSIQAHQEQQLREDELRAALWIHQVTGDEASGAAAAGKGSLQEALQTGEVLCDLINAIWDGKIVGISRGPESQKLFRRVANITLFIQFCKTHGISHSVFVPADLAEGRNFRSVVRCLCALAQHVPETWDGPRMPHGG